MTEKSYPAYGTLISQLLEIRKAMTDSEKTFSHLLEQVYPSNLKSAQNLIHYLVLRSFDIRTLQDQLHIMGLSSLASSESHTLAQIETVLSRLHADFDSSSALCSYEEANMLKSWNNEQLFGAFPEKKPQIMITLSSEMVNDPGVFEEMLQAGMTVARINCAHDDQEIWQKMISLLKEAILRTGKSCKIYMDLPGPKIRIKAIATETGLEEKLPLREMDKVRLTIDTKKKGKKTEKLPVLYIEPAGILHFIQPNEHLYFDDGKFEGIIIKKSDTYVIAEITRISTKKPFLKSGKGINLPHTNLSLPALTDEDKLNLPFICKHAHMIGYSFVSAPEDIEQLRSLIRSCSENAPPAIILKIERLKAVINLPDLLLNGLKDSAVGVMIARGDLAVEIGFERLSEIQEEILWICEAAHIPVVWATQVLEKMNKKGNATRSEISDAAQSIKAECVMLNKGNFIIKTIKLLSDILKLQYEHKNKKRYTLRPLNIARNFIAKI